MKTMILALVLALMAADVIMAQGDPVARNAVMAVERLQAEPDIDGVIESDPAWKNVPWNNGAFYILNTDKKADLQTKFKIGYTAKGIYLAVQCDEPQPGNMIATKNDMESVWADDSIEIWLSTGKADRLQLVLNSTGARNNAGIDMLLNWPVATFIGENFWNSEIFIPYETIKQIPDGKWQLGVCRNIQTLKTKPCFTAWRLVPPAKSYSDLLPLSFSGSLSEQEKNGVLDLIRKKQTEALKSKYSMAVVSPGKGVELLRKGLNNELLLMAQGSGLMPRISPDGSTLYFNSTSGGQRGIWKSGIADRKTDRICDGSQVACSADGKSIVFQRHGRIMSRQLDNGAEKIISPEAWTDCAYPEYLPDNRVIFTVSGNPDKMYLASGDKMPELLFSGEIGGTARSSPDGRLIAYQNGPHLWLYDIAARSSSQLTAINGIQCCPSWTKDSKNVIFCQLFDQFNSIGDVYVQDIAGKSIERITQNVDLFPDFTGEWQFTKNAVAITAPPVIKVSCADKTPAAVTDIPADAKEIVLDSGGAALSVSRANNQIEWLFKDSSGKIYPLQIVPLNLKGLPFSGINAVKLAKDGNNRIVCRIELGGSESGSVAIVLEAGLPVLKISTNDVVGRVDLRHKLKMVAGSDRYAWDLLYLPSDIKNYPAAAASSALMIMFPESCNYLFMVTAPESDIWLVRGSRNTEFGGLSVAAEKNNREFYLLGMCGINIRGGIDAGETGTAVNSTPPAAQCGTSMCPPLSAVSASLLSGKIMTMKCSVPAALQWRYIVADKHGNDYSGMFMSNAAANGFEFKIPVLPLMQGAASAFYYPYDRVKLTPLQNAAPMDLIINAAGLKNTEQFFDSRGLRQVRPANPECMFKDYRIILNWYKYTYITQPCAAETACRMADDLSAIFNGVLNRNAEYQKFFAELKVQAGKLPQAEFAAQVNDIVKSSERLNAGAGSAKKFGDSLEKFRAAAIKLNAKDATKELTDIANQLFQQELINIQQSRLLVKQLRMIFGRLVTIYPENKASYEKIRDDCRKLLLYPVFHENMNNDENIINPELADYEATK